MRFRQELHIQAPIEFVYEYLRDFEQLHEDEVMKFRYDHLDTGGRSIGVLQGEGKHRLHHRGETFFAEYPSRYIERTVLSSRSATITTVTSVDLETTKDGGTRIYISQTVSYTWKRWPQLLPHKAFIEQQEQMWATYKQKIEQAYQQNPELKRKLPPKSKVSTNSIEMRWWDRGKWMKLFLDYLGVLLLVVWYWDGIYFTEIFICTICCSLRSLSASSMGIDLADCFIG